MWRLPEKWQNNFAAAIALYMLVLDGEDGAEVYMAATTRGQARICWTEARNMVGKSSALTKKSSVGHTP